jgi:uncharacterized protein (TIGR02266 family)
MVNGSKNENPGYVLLRPDRRKNLRSHLLVLNLKAESNKRSFFGYAKVIGRGGLFIASVNPKQVGEEFTIEFTLPDKTPVQCKCSVAWRREFTPKFKYEPGMGIKFLDMPDEIRGKIDTWAKKG